MSNDLEWLYETVDFYGNYIGLTEWEIDVSVERVVNGSENVLGCCSVHPNINHARIIFRNDIENNEYWHEVILHELLHVLHGRIDHYVEQVVFPSAGQQLELIFNETYTTALEPFIHNLAKRIAPILFAEWTEHYAESDTTGTDDDGSGSGGNTASNSENLQDNTKQRWDGRNRRNRNTSDNCSMRLRTQKRY